MPRPPTAVTVRLTTCVVRIECDAMRPFVMHIWNLATVCQESVELQACTIRRSVTL